MLRGTNNPLKACVITHEWILSHSYMCHWNPLSNNHYQWFRCIGIFRLLVWNERMEYLWRKDRCSCQPNTVLKLYCICTLCVRFFCPGKIVLRFVGSSSFVDFVHPLLGRMNDDIIFFTCSAHTYDVVFAQREAKPRKSWRSWGKIVLAGRRYAMRRSDSEWGLTKLMTRKIFFSLLPSSFPIFSIHEAIYYMFLHDIRFNDGDEKLDETFSDFGKWRVSLSRFATQCSNIPTTCIMSPTLFWGILTFRIHYSGQ